MFSRKRRLLSFIAAGAAAIAVAVGGFAIGNSGSGNGTSSTANAAQAAAPPHGPRSGQPGRPGQSGQPSGDTLTPVSGQIPKGWSPGSGTIITGAAADKAKAAALADNVQGTVNRVLKLNDGSYVVHMFATSGPHHVFVSKDFKVTGIA